MNTMGDLESYAAALGAQARSAGYEVAGLSGRQRNETLRRLAEEMRGRTAELEEANRKDVAAAEENGLTKAMIDRLRLTKTRVETMAKAVEEVAAQPDPVGETISATVRPNGLRVEKRRVPLGVVAIIYEARPNVTSDAASLCFKSGNACILRGGKESFHSNLAIGRCIEAALTACGVTRSAVQIVNTTDRALVPLLLKQNQNIDVVIPRGGESLIRAVVEQSTIPVIKHYTGNCHVYVDARCNADMAESIVLNAKCQRPSVCNAAETLLVHKAVAADFLCRVGSKLIAAGVELRACPVSQKLLSASKPATEDDWYKEYLELILAVKVVDSLDEAIDHINTYGSHHTDAIVTDDIAAADRFVNGVDSSSVMVNTSTRFSDGGEYGLGAEIGISTDKLHARGPMGAADLTTYKFVVTGAGQIRQ
jgi:glutamate-5-semialdehyde dehydrogenase